MTQSPLVWLDYRMDTGGSGNMLETKKPSAEESNGSVNVLAMVWH